MRLKQTIFTMLLLLSGTQASHAQDWFKGEFGPPLDTSTRTYQGGTPAGLSMGELKLSGNFASFGTTHGHMELRFVETVACRRTEKYWYVPPCGHLYRVENWEQFAAENPALCPARWLAVRTHSASGLNWIDLQIYSVADIHRYAPDKPGFCLESSFGLK
jgi:hypothetical protein